MKPGRSSVSANDRIDTGTPPISRGSGDVCTVRPPSGRSLIDASTVTGAEVDRADLAREDHLEPGQAAVLRAGQVHVAVERDRRVHPAPRRRRPTLPTRVPTGRPLSEPARPGGRSAVTCERSSAPSGRVISIATDPAGRPAAVEAAADLQPGRERRQRAALVDREARAARSSARSRSTA